MLPFSTWNDLSSAPMRTRSSWQMFVKRHQGVTSTSTVLHPAHSSDRLILRSIVDWTSRNSIIVGGELESSLLLSSSLWEHKPTLLQ